MGRVARYTIVGGFLAVFALGLYGAFDGYQNGAGANRQHLPGFTGAVMNVMILLGFFGLVAWVMGAFAGMVAGMVGQAVDRLGKK